MVMLKQDLAVVVAVATPPPSATATIITAKTTTNWFTQSGGRGSSVGRARDSR